MCWREKCLGVNCSAEGGRSEQDSERRDQPLACLRKLERTINKVKRLRLAFELDSFVKDPADRSCHPCCVSSEREVSLKYVSSRSIVAAALCLATLGTHLPAALAELPAATRLAMPGPNHQRLDALVGEWKVDMRVWPAAGATPIASSDLKATRTWVLGKRYLREDLSGTFAGNPSNRVGYFSYNNLEERFELTTIDTFEPGQMWYVSHSTGKAGLISLHGDNVEAGFGPKATGRKRALRFDIEIAPQRSVQRIYVKYPGETEFLFVEQVFTPAK